MILILPRRGFQPRSTDRRSRRRISKRENLRVVMARYLIRSARQELDVARNLEGLGHAISLDRGGVA